LTHLIDHCVLTVGLHNARMHAAAFYLRMHFGDHSLIMMGKFDTALESMAAQQQQSHRVKC
jgi:hypothetical protein